MEREPEVTETNTHPRPQLVRTDWLDICGEWQFAFDRNDVGLTERWFAEAEPFDRTITVPYPPESKLSGVHEPDTPAVVWYRRSFTTPRPAADHRTLLHFGAVDYRARVWVNGQYVGSHEGGHTPFRFDVTQALVDTGDQTVVVCVEDRPDDVTQPRGKQTWAAEPHGIWYRRTTGIWQPVWLEDVPAIHVDELHWTPDPANARVGVEVRLSEHPSRPLRLRIRLRLGEGLLAEHTELVTGAYHRGDVAIAAARNAEDLAKLLWSPDHPTLLDASVTLLDADDVIDDVASYVGLRTVGIGDGRFLLNGQQAYPRLVLEQGYWPQSHLAAPSADALRREVELVKQLGFNGMRIHQKIEDPRFLYWCDRIGLLVWEEMPSAFEFEPATVDRLVREWLDVVRRDRSHPCVVTWVPFNESWGVRHLAEVPAQRHYATALYQLTKAIDPTRPVISNDGWEHTESDIWSVHDYAVRGDALRERYGSEAALTRTLRERRPTRRRVLLGEPEYRGQPVILSEFGGLSYAPEPGEHWFGYGTVSSVEEYESQLADLVDAVLDSAEIAGFCYTQLTDTEQERNGLLTEDREPKLPIERLRAIIGRPAAAVPAEEIDASRTAARRISDSDTGAGGDS
ncbi:MAG: glycoside hydrolase family 2 [Streptosporangiales bacterium]|nr:glycoside hydrolase family 2 [Streptosporangiales bacterium]